MEKEKIAQAIEILRELDIDLWMVIDRESGIITDPVMDYVVGCHATWLSFFLFSRTGEKHAIVGNLDVETFRRAGLFDTVSAYKGSPKDDLLRLLRRLDPKKIAIDYSPDCAAADGLTHGNYLNLLELLQGHGFRGAPDLGRGGDRQAARQKIGRRTAPPAPGLRDDPRDLRPGGQGRQAGNERTGAGRLDHGPARENGADGRLGRQQLPRRLQRPAGDRRPLGAHGQRPEAGPYLQHRFRGQGGKILLRPAAHLVHPAAGGEAGSARSAARVRRPAANRSAWRSRR